MPAELDQKKKEIVGFLVGKGVLVNADFLEKLNDSGIVEQMHAKLEQNPEPQQILEFQKNTETAPKTTEAKVKVLWEYETEYNKRKIQDFVNYFNARYKLLEKMLIQRPEMQNITSIARLLNKQDKETVSIIGMVTEKRLTRNENIIVTVEDNTGQISVVFSKNKQDLFTQAKDLVLDEVIGIGCSTGENILFANSILFPDIPLQTELKKSPDEAYVLILSDLHVGSIWFERERFGKFLKWIKGEAGNEEQKEVARKVKYIFIPGDIVDGVGIYPGMEEHLNIPDIHKQYHEAAQLIKQIPQHIWLIISPGNHDIGRMAEPQPALSQDYTKELWEMPNVIMTCNPALINIHSSQEFTGFNFLIYHGYSYDHYAEAVESIKTSGRHLSERVDLVMKFMLQRRHLAPSHSTTLYIPDPKTDPLVIQTVPDFFISGHVHKAAVSTYRGVSIVCGSCWQGQTAFQDKVGHIADPGKVPIINLKTRQIKLMRF